MKIHGTIKLRKRTDLEVSAHPGWSSGYPSGEVFSITFLGREDTSANTMPSARVSMNRDEFVKLAKSMLEMAERNPAPVK